MSNRSGAATDQQSNSDDAKQLITIIVPTRNEADNIEPLLDKLSAALHDMYVEVLFVDDSSDNTAQIVTSLQNHYPFQISIIERSPEQQNGLSGAVVDGLRAANGEWVCVMDADLQHPPETIPHMWEKAEKTGADMVVGSRRGDLVGPIGLTRMRSLTSKALTILARMLFPRLLRNVSDPLTGLFLVKRSMVDVDVLRPDGFKILLEILVRCPALHVTEIHFDFAPRHEGQSKADVREGVRFFRHVVRLRITVNPHLIRFLISLLISFSGNMLLLWLLVERFDYRPLLAGFLAVEILALWIAFIFDKWVFRERNSQQSKRSFWKSFLLAQIVIIPIYLPLMLGFVAGLNLNYLLANTLSLLVVGLLLYGISEQWILTKDSMVWQAEVYYYNLHDILMIESQVELADLQYFSVDSPGDGVDIQLKLDRQGTPSHLPGGISYDERLGRFGFGMTVLPGDFQQIIVSPLLGRSPGFLFTNIVEPIIRWSLVPKGYAFVKAAAVSSVESAVLIHSNEDMGHKIAAVCREYGYQFFADDLTIVDQVGKVYSYPKPVTINQKMLRESAEATGAHNRQPQFGQRILYTRFARRVGLWLSGKNLPAATLNTYLQRFLPQTKDMLNIIFPEIEYGKIAQCETVAAVGIGKHREESAMKISRLLQMGEESAGFQPHPLLAGTLRYQYEKDLMLEEQGIIDNLAASSEIHYFEEGNGDWGIELVRKVMDINLVNSPSQEMKRPSRNESTHVKISGEPKST